MDNQIALPDNYLENVGFNYGEQFLDVSEKVLSKTSSSIARYVGAAVWKSQGDIRDVISIVKLVRKSDGPEEIERIISMMYKYSREAIRSRKVDASSHGNGKIYANTIDEKA